MRKSLLNIFRHLLVGCILYSITGCALTQSSKNSLSAIDNTSNVAIEETESDYVPLADFIQDSSVAIQELIDAAKRFCNGQQFQQADSVLKIAIESVGLQSSDSTNYEFYLNDILAIYTDLMPPDIQIPEDIATLAYEQKMLRSLDSLSFSIDDSSLMQNLLCGKTTSYNVPILWNERVLRAVYYYQKNRQSTINHWIPRSNRYLPTMKKIFADSGLPEDLAYLPLIESGFNPKAYSHAHASGIWQFIPSTGKIYGLRNNYWLDERRDPVKSTIAASRYLKKLYKDFNDWHLALAAYNCGEGGLGRAINRCNTNNYWELTLPRETMNYVPLYLAALTIAKNPSCFNLQQPSDTATFKFDTVYVNECLDLKDIANGLEISYDTLRKMNPHILHWCTPPDLSNVLLYLPLGYSQPFKQFHATIPDSKKVKWYRYKIRHGDNISTIAKHFKVPVEPIKSINRLSSNRIIAGKYLFIPIPTSRSVPDDDIQVSTSESNTKQTVAESGKKITYRVKPGDSVWHISEMFGIPPEKICAWNQLDNDAAIKAGQLLTIYQQNEVKQAEKVAAKSQEPKLDQTEYLVKQGDTPYSIARQFKMSLNEFIELNNLDPNKPLIHPNDKLIVRKQDTPLRSSPGTPADKTNHMKYQVSPGETLYAISRIFSVSIQELRAANGLDPSSTIKAGDILLIPSSLKPNSLGIEQSPIVFYEVKQGDNLWRIANSFGITVQSLYEYNNLTSDSVLMPGDTIKVVRSGEM